MSTPEIDAITSIYWQARKDHDQVTADRARDELGKAIERAQDVTEFAGVTLPADVKKLVVIQPGSLTEWRGGILWRGSVGFDDGWYPFDKRIEQIGFKWVEEWSDAFRANWRRDADRVLISYCEGDLTVEVYPDEAIYQSALGFVGAFWDRINAEREARWDAIGLRRGL